MPKCAYCHKDAMEKIPADYNIGLQEQYYCSEICKKELTDYINAAKKNGNLFIGLTLGSILIMVIGNGLISALNFDEHYTFIVMFVALSVVGITIIKFPFCTPQTVRMVGIKKAKIVARILGLILIIIGGLIIGRFSN
ncbi:MAG: hypothetical protein CVU90_07525 [Firmicutes bacterium HGW-Firmicutes-15]|nr:MAG: hypothetical protein CVU90_07525 [Firmicutes bacterium HGW-Firmicutes-15]